MKEGVWGYQNISSIEKHDVFVKKKFSKVPTERKYLPTKIMIILWITTNQQTIPRSYRPCCGHLGNVESRAATASARAAGTAYNPL